MQASLQGAREIVGPVISMTITLAAVYAPIGFLGGLTGSLFREFAFTLAGSGDRVRRDRADAVADDVLGASSRAPKRDGSPRLVNRVFGAMTRWYGRQLDRSLDYRPITGLFALTILGLVGFLYMHTSKELAPEEDQGIVFAVTKAPKYANIDYVDFYGDKARQGVRRSFPRPTCASSLNGINGPQNGIAGMLLKPWDERKRSSITAEAAGAGGASQDRGRQRLRLQPAAAARRSRRPAGADGDQLDRPASRPSTSRWRS